MYRAVWDGYHAAQRSERARRRRCRRRCTEYLSFRVQGKIEESLEMLKTTLKLKPDHEKGQAKLKQAKKAEKAKIAVRALKLKRTRTIDRLWRLCGPLALWLELQAFKKQVDDAIKKAEEMQRRGEL